MQIETRSNSEVYYVAGYITHKLKLSASNDRKPNSWISLKGEGRLRTE